MRSTGRFGRTVVGCDDSEVIVCYGELYGVGSGLVWSGGGLMWIVTQVQGDRGAYE